MTDTLARMRQIIGTTAAWGAHDIVLGDGEIALERVNSQTVRAKIGNGADPFSLSPYLGSDLDIANADLRYVQQSKTVTTGGVPNANLWPRLGPDGKLDPSLLKLPAAFTYKGTANPTQPPPVGAAAGDVYVVSPGGVVNAAWGAPVAGQNATEGQLLVLGGDGTWALVNSPFDLEGVVLESELAGPGGATMVGTADGGNVEEALDQLGNDIAAVDTDVRQRVIYAETRPAMAGLDPTESTVCYLKEDGRQGLFRYRTGAAPADPQQGLYVPSTTTGYWARDWDRSTGLAEWFGAVAGDVSKAAANKTAIQACLNLCPTTQLGGGVYYTDGTLIITRNGTALIGHSHTQTDCSGMDGSPLSTTQIMCTSATATIIQVGQTSAPQPTWLSETIRLEGFTVNRTVAPVGTASELVGAMGIDCRWIVNCHFERVFSLNSSIGWRFWGTVENYVMRCGALRDKEGPDAANDTFIGFLIDQDSPGPWNGGNASLTLDKCRVFPLTGNLAPSLTYSAGVRFNGGWVDCWVDGFECGSGIGYGIHAEGKGPGTETFRDEDLFIRHCILDPGNLICLYITNCGIETAVTCTDNYIACNPGATAVAVQRCGGCVVIANNQLITTGSSTGMSYFNCAALRSENNIVTNFAVPHNIQQVYNSTIRDTVTSTVPDRGYAAITLRDCHRCTVDSVVNSNVKAYSAGVNLEGGANSEIEVACTNINPAALIGPTKKLILGSTDIVAAGPFGTNCLARGIMN